MTAESLRFISSNGYEHTHAPHRCDAPSKIWVGDSLRYQVKPVLLKPCLVSYFMYGTSTRIVAVAFSSHKNLR